MRTRSFRLRASLIPLLACFAVSTLPARAAAPNVLPPATAVKGWKMLGKPRVYNAGNLYNLINGEAEAILNYAFVACAHGEYAPASGSRPVLTIDVYDMTDPLNAFGMFSGSDRMSGKSVAMGAEGVQIGNSGLNFWKGRYVVRTTLIGTGAVTAGNQSAQKAFARSAATRISGPSGPPALLKALPAGRQPRSEKYVRKNVAGHAFLSNAVTARYPKAGFGAEVFIAKYPSAAAAKKAYASYRAFEKKGTGLAAVKGIGDEAFSVQDPFAKSVAVARKGSHVIGAIRAKDKAGAVSLVKQAAAKL